MTFHRYLEFYRPCISNRYNITKPAPPAQCLGNLNGAIARCSSLWNSLMSSCLSRCLPGTCIRRLKHSGPRPTRGSILYLNFGSPLTMNPSRPSLASSICWKNSGLYESLKISSRPVRSLIKPSALPLSISIFQSSPSPVQRIFPCTSRKSNFCQPLPPEELGSLMIYLLFDVVLIRMSCCCCMS